MRVDPRPPGLNLGDDISDPHLYFNNLDKLNILGGGSYPILESYSENTILWSVGLSIKSKVEYTIHKLPFTVAGIRDECFVDKYLFLPCVSCMNNDIISEPVGNETLYYLNASHPVNHPHALYNNCSLNTFLDVWRQSETIVTNSYHGIYWALLSKRRVIPFGYSTKFISVLRMFGLELPTSNFYVKEKSADVLNKIDYTILESSVDRLQEFRDRNNEFAEKVLNV